MDLKKVLSGVIVVVMVVVTGLVSYNYGSRKVVVQNSDVVAKQTAVDFVNAIVKGDVDKTYTLASAAYQAKNTKDKVKLISDSLKSETPLISDEEIFFGKDQATNQAIYLSSVSNLPPNSFDRTTGNFVIRLIVEDGTWKVDSSQVY